MIYDPYPSFNKKRLSQSDPILYELIQRDELFYANSLDMIAGLAIPTRAVFEAMLFSQANRTTEGLLRRRFIGTGGLIDEIEDLAIRRACQLFGFQHANVQVNSGTQANLAVQQAVCSVGDTILSMNLNQGGHLSHGFQESLSGKLYNVIHYGVNSQSFVIDFDEVRSLAKMHKPKLIIAGSSSYPRRIDYQEFSNIAEEVEAHLLIDISHPAGFIAADIFDVPKSPQVIISTTTEKTLCGPRGGLILCSKDLGDEIDRAVFPRLQSSFTVSSVAGKAAIFQDAQRIEFRELQRGILRNAQLIAARFLERGLHLISGGTDTHIILVDLSTNGVFGRDIERLLLDVNIMANRQVIPYDKMKPAIASGIRFGTTNLTIQNMSPSNIVVLVDQICNIIVDRMVSDTVRDNINELLQQRRFVRPHPLFIGMDKSEQLD